MINPFEVVGTAVAPGACATWLAQIDDAYREAAEAPLGAFVAESSSFRLTAIAGLTVESVWDALHPVVHQRCADALGPGAVIDVDACWVRRQYAPGTAPARHRPHSWHQDGALGFDFVGHGDQPMPVDATLPMLTIWIPLLACGVDAPGLEIVVEPVDILLRPAELTDRAIDQRWPAPRRVRPAMAAGDAAIFGGGILHRTACSAAMSRTRTSVELRCFPAAVPHGRLRADRFLSLG